MAAPATPTFPELPVENTFGKAAVNAIASTIPGIISDVADEYDGSDGEGRGNRRSVVIDLPRSNPFSEAPRSARSGRFADESNSWDGGRRRDVTVLSSYNPFPRTPNNTELDTISAKLRAARLARLAREDNERALNEPPRSGGPTRGDSCGPRKGGLNVPKEAPRPRPRGGKKGNRNSSNTSGSSSSSNEDK